LVIHNKKRRRVFINLSLTYYLEVTLRQLAPPKKYYFKYKKEASRTHFVPHCVLGLKPSGLITGEKGLKRAVKF
jgi:hypothetical protein